MNDQIKFETYNAYCNICLIDLLMFSKNIGKDLEDFRMVIVNPEFIERYRNIIKLINESNPYPKETYENMKKITKFIDENSFGFEELIQECKEILDNMIEFNNDRYLEEFTTKYDDLEDFKNNSCHIWNKNDILESIRYDYFMAIFLTCDKEQFLLNLDNFILNKKFIFGLKKIINICPEILELLEIYNRVLEILEFNIEATTEYDNETVLSYIKKNYNQIEQFNLEELNKFRKLNEEMYDKVANLDSDKFDIEEFTNYYKMLKLETYLYFDEETNLDDIDIDTIYLLIEENVENPNLTISEIGKLKDILNLKRNNLTKEEIRTYNNHVVMLNQIEPEQYHFETGANRMLKIDEFRVLLPFNKKIMHEILELQRYDLEHFEALLSDDIEQIKDNYKDICFYRSILRFMRECPIMFASESIRKNAIEILKVCEEKQSKKIIRKLEKR